MTVNKEFIKKLLFELTAAGGTAGEEKEIFSVISENLPENIKAEIETKNGNMRAFIGDKNKTSVLLDAHTDKIGFVVVSIDSKGFLKLAKVGGCDMRVMQGSPLIIKGERNIMGVVCNTPPHLSDGREDRAIKEDSLWVDCGLSKKEIEKIVSIGDRATFFSKPCELLEDKIAAPGLDNRAGVAALICCAHILNDMGYKGNVEFLFSSREETNGAGAITGGFETTASTAVAVDTSFAEQPDNLKGCNPGTLGKGTMICYSSTLDKKVTNKLVNICENKNIPYQKEVWTMRTGTNADKLGVSKGGIKCGLVSVPLRYMHTACEVININDVKYTAELLAEFVISGGVKDE